MKEKKRIDQPEAMHCRGKIVASAVEVFLLLWHLQDIEQHKSANEQIHINAMVKTCMVWGPTGSTPISTAPFMLLFKDTMLLNKIKQAFEVWKIYRINKKLKF